MNETGRKIERIQKPKEEIKTQENLLE